MTSEIGCLCLQVPLDHPALEHLRDRVRRDEAESAQHRALAASSSAARSHQYITKSADRFICGCAARAPRCSRRQAAARRSLPPMNGGLPTMNSASGHSGPARVAVVVDRLRPPSHAPAAARRGQLLPSRQHGVHDLDVVERLQDRLAGGSPPGAEVPLQVADPQHQFGDGDGARVDLHAQELVRVDRLLRALQAPPVRRDRPAPRAPRPRGASSAPSRHRGSCRCRRPGSSTRVRHSFWWNVAHRVRRLGVRALRLSGVSAVALHVAPSRRAAAR